MNYPNRMLNRVERVQGALLLGVMLGSILAFNGQVWWYAPLIASATLLLCLTWIVRGLILGEAHLLKTPLAACGLLAIALGVAQLVPWPARWLPSSTARVAGFGEERAQTLESSTEHGDRLVISVDRSATLRWVFGALACWVVFVVSGDYVDRVSRLRALIGSLAVGIGVCTLFGWVQLVGQADAPYGVFDPARGAWWAPNAFDHLSGPHIARWREVARAQVGAPAWLMPEREPVFAPGPCVSGPGAYLALAALALPLLLGVVLHALAPRGSREPLSLRLRSQGGAAWVLLAVCVLAAASALSGYLGGAILAGTIGAGLILVGLGASIGTQTTRAGLGLMMLCAGSLAVGCGLGDWLGRPAGAPWLSDRTSQANLFDLWKHGMEVGLQYAVLGVGMNAFNAIVPQIKGVDAANSTAGSSVLQWAVEGGLVSLALLVAVFVWIAWRLPAAWKRVGGADRALPAGLMGSLFAFALFSSIHWSIQLMVVALVAAGVAGVANRWLAGATDLFVEAA